jgi:proteasome accessory factor C
VADAVQVALDTEARMQPVVQTALDRGRALRLRYYTAARDETSDRVVDPVRAFTSDGRAYLEAWCRQAEGVRVFRLDRIEDAQLLDEPARPPADLPARDLSEGVYAPAPEHLLVDLLVGDGYAWVGEYYGAENEDDTPAGRIVSVRVSDPAWVRSLALSSAGEVRVLAPSWLADEISATASAALSAYE